jgi:hypothetical protein
LTYTLGILKDTPILGYSETSEIHEQWFKTRMEDYSEEVREMLIRGTKISAVDYIHAYFDDTKLPKNGCPRCGANNNEPLPIISSTFNYSDKLWVELKFMHRDKRNSS